MSEERFNNREIDAKIAAQSVDLKSYMKELIEPLTVQVTYTNGRMRKLERYILIISCVLGTVVFLKYPQVIAALKLFL